jgi:hypothetical protein
LGPVMFLKKLGVVRKTKKKAVHQRKKND